MKYVFLLVYEHEKISIIIKGQYDERRTHRAVHTSEILVNVYEQKLKEKKKRGTHETQIKVKIKIFEIFHAESDLNYHDDIVSFC